MTATTGEVLKIVVEGINKNDGNVLTSQNIDTAQAELDSILLQIPGTNREHVKPLTHILLFAKDGDWNKMNRAKSKGVETYRSLLSQIEQSGKKSLSTTESTKQVQKTSIEIPISYGKGKHVTPIGNNSDQYHPKEETKELTGSTNNKLRGKDEEIEILKNRLSRYAGERLRDGNASITDLSDKNRPIKLAEYFSELYDNEWTDAFNHLQTKDKSEEVAVTTLLNVLQTAYDYSQRCAEKQRHILMQSLLFPTLSDASRSELSPQSEKELPVMGMVKQIQKDSAEFAVINLRKDFFSQKLDGAFADPHVKAYIYKCLQVTWLFSVQDPPLCLLWDKKGDSTKDYLRPFTRQGKRIDFPVWPTLLLHDNGPVLSKGVAQFQ